MKKVPHFVELLLVTLLLMGATYSITTYVNTTEIAAPAVSALGSATMYADSTSHTWKISNNNGAYVDILSNATGPFLPESGGTMLGQIAFSTGIATEIAGGANEDLTIAASGSGNLVLASGTGTVVTGVGLNIQNNMQNSSTNKCNSETNSDGYICAFDDLGIWLEAPYLIQKGTGSPQHQIVGTAVTDAELNVYVDQTNAVKAQIGYFNSGFADVDFASKFGMRSVSSMEAFIRDDDVADGTVGWEFRDNAAASGVQLVGIRGDGTIVMGPYLGQTGTANPQHQIHGTANTDSETLSLIDNTSTTQGQFGYFNSASGDADFNSKVVVRSISNMIAFIHDNDVAAGTVAYEFRDNATGTGVPLVTIDGDGNVFLNASATKSKNKCTLNGATPSVCTGTVAANSICVCSPVGTTLAIAAGGCAVSLSSTTLTITGPAAASNDVNYHCE